MKPVTKIITCQNDYHYISGIYLFSYCVSLPRVYCLLAQPATGLAVFLLWIELGVYLVLWGQRDLFIWREESKGFRGIWVILDLMEVRKKRVEPSTKGWSVSKKFLSPCSGDQTGLSGTRKDPSPYSKSQCCPKELMLPSCWS